MPGAGDCPYCGNLYAFVSGGLRGVLCRVEACHAGYVTSNLPEIVSDHVEYTCFVESLPEDWKRAVAWLANRFHIPVSQVRKHRDDPALPLIRCRAHELVLLRREFEERGIRIRIEPEFKWSSFEVPPDGEMPLDESELRTMCEFIRGARERDSRGGEDG